MRNASGRLREVGSLAIVISIIFAAVFALEPMFAVAPPQGTLDAVFYDMAPPAHTFPGDKNVTMIWLEMTASVGDVRVNSISFALSGSAVVVDITSVALWDDSGGILGPDKLQGHYECQLAIRTTGLIGTFSIPATGNLSNCNSPFGDYIVTQFQTRYILVFVSIATGAIEGHTVRLAINTITTDGAVNGGIGTTKTIEILHKFFSDNMESGQGSWIGDGWDAGHVYEPIGLWHLSSGEESCKNNMYGQPFYQSPTTGWWYGHRYEDPVEPGTYVCSYCTWMPGQYSQKTRNMGNLTTPDIDATAGSSLAVTFRHMLTGEPDTGLLKVDNGHLWIWDGSWHKITPYPDGYDSTENSWWKEIIDLSAYAGKHIKLQFRFDTMDAMNNEWLGWFLDDITIHGKYIPTIPPPTNLTTTPVGNDILLEWDQSVSPTLTHYLIYGETDQREFDFSVPLYNTSNDLFPTRTNWTDVGAAGPGSAIEYYYVVRAVTSDYRKSITSNTAGKWTGDFSSGLSAFSLPLEPFESHNVSWYSEDIPKVEFIRWMDPSGHWITHHHGVGEGIRDAPLRMGRGYEIDLTLDIIYTFCGQPASMTRFQEGLGDSIAFRKGLTAQISGSNVVLAWNQANESTEYRIFRSDERGGLHNLSLTPIATVPFPQNTWTDMGVLSVSGERYYMVIPVDSEGELGSSTYSVGVITALYNTGSDTLALPLDATEVHALDWYSDHIPGIVGMAYMVFEVWKFHARDMPERIYDVTVHQGEGYQISTDGAITGFTFVGH